MDENSTRMVGWLTRDKGQSCLANAFGKYLLEDLDKAVAEDAVRPGDRPAMVVGDRPGPASVRVKEACIAARPARGREPYFARHPNPALEVGSDLRGRVHHWLRQRNFVEVTLPTVWGRSEEYGVEEFTLAHSKVTDGGALKLLQSPEFPLYTALASGVDRCFTFGRCYRHESEPGEDRQGDYLMEFEQLVIATSFTDLPEMVALAQQLIVALAQEVGIGLDDRDFCFVGPPGLSPPPHAKDLVIDDLLFFTLPAQWPVRARQVLHDRLVGLGTRVHRLDGERSHLLGRPGETTRWAIEPLAAPRSKLTRVLEIAESQSSSAGADVSQLLVQQWNPTWNIYPPLYWRDNERRDSQMPIRSITSRCDRASNGVACIADAELYLADREVTHIRAYADGAQFAENLRLAGIDDGLRRYGYLINALEAAPPGMAGIFIGWERLLSVLAGTKGAADALLFPRMGDGHLHVPCGPQAGDAPPADRFRGERK